MKRLLIAFAGAVLMFSGAAIADDDGVAISTSADGQSAWLIIDGKVWACGLTTTPTQQNLEGDMKYRCVPIPLTSS